MLSLDEQQMIDEMNKAGFEVAARATTGADGRLRYNLSGRGPYGAFVVSAPTEAGAYRLGLAQAQRHMIPVRLAYKGSY